MIELEMHWSSGYYHESRYLPSPLDPRCCNCQFMPDNECGWGYSRIDECVFQADGQYTIEICEDGMYFVNDVYPHSLVEYIDDALLLHMVRDDWSFREGIEQFYDRYRSAVYDIKYHGKQLAQYYSDYYMWFFSKEPCACCGKLSQEFVVFGDKRKGNEIKLCERCADNEWTSTYGR